MSMQATKQPGHADFAGFVATGGTHGMVGSSVMPRRDMGLTLDIDTDIDYSSLGQSVFTPHYGTINTMAYTPR
jgi:hypothetical protein